MFDAIYELMMPICSHIECNVGRDFYQYYFVSLDGGGWSIECDSSRELWKHVYRQYRLWQ